MLIEREKQVWACVRTGAIPDVQDGIAYTGLYANEEKFRIEDKVSEEGSALGAFILCACGSLSYNEV